MRALSVIAVICAQSSDSFDGFFEYQPNMWACAVVGVYGGVRYMRGAILSVHLVHLPRIPRRAP